MNAHPDVEALAAYAAGDLEPADAGAVAEHVVGCASCAADLAGIRQATAQLAALPQLPMPADVAASIDAALAAERAPATPEPAEPDPAEPEPAPVTPIETRRRRRSLAPIVTGAAAAALIGAIGFGVLTRNVPGGGAAGSSDNGTQEFAAPETRYFTSGYTYDQSNVEAGALKLLAGDAPTFAPATADQRSAESAAPAIASSPTGFVSGEDSGTGTTNGAGGAGGAAIPDLTRCLDLLREDTSVRPVAVDHAMFEGQPAYVIVLPFRQGEYDVFVVTRRCGETDDATLLHFQRVRASS